MPVVVAQLLPPTVAQPPRMPLVPGELVAMPLVPPMARLAGFVKSTVAPTFRVIAPTERSSGLAVDWLVSEMAEGPGLSVRPATVWELVVLALPVIAKVPPPRTSPAVGETRFVAEAVAAEKSSLSVPLLTVVGPV